MFNEFGVDPGKFFLQLAIFLVPAILATIQIVRYREGIPRVLWLVAVWLVIPFVASIAALCLVRSPRPVLGR